MSEGRRQAFRQLVERLVPLVWSGLVPQPTDAELGRFVLGFEVAGERTSAVRYLAELTVAFDRTAVRAAFRDASVPFAETQSLPVLVIPVLSSGAGTVLWEEPNPWRDAWARRAAPRGLVPFVVPYGDLADIRDLSIEQALSGDQPALIRIAERYGARDAVVAQAIPRPGGAVQVTIQRIGSSGHDSTLVETVVAEGDPANAAGYDAARYDAGVRRAIVMVEEGWKQDNLIRPGLESRVTATIPLDSLQRWLSIRRTLDRLPVLSRYDVVQLTRREALIDLWVNGDAEQLRIAFEQQDLELVPGAGDYILKQRGQPLPIETPLISPSTVDTTPSEGPATGPILAPRNNN
ncbi:MAG: DUF2066 domain-containing protein [Alphaproteobacteria bacterium]|nr:DUF2066 domain-containing protein [Alphaproteobacteria bacterium]